MPGDTAGKRTEKGAGGVIKGLQGFGAGAGAHMRPPSHTERDPPFIEKQAGVRRPSNLHRQALSALRCGDEGARADQVHTGRGTRERRKGRCGGQAADHPPFSGGSCIQQQSSGAAQRARAAATRARPLSFLQQMGGCSERAGARGTYPPTSRRGIGGGRPRRARVGAPGQGCVGGRCGRGSDRATTERSREEGEGEEEHVKI